MNKFIIILPTILILLSCKKSDTPILSSTDTELLYYCSRAANSGTWQVYLKNLNTAVVQTITDDDSFNYWWVVQSPDKTELLLLRSPVTSSTDQYDYDNCEMIKCNADGTNPRVIISDNQYDWFAFGNPHWHPTGDRILMIAQESNATAPFNTYTVDTNGNNPTRLIDQYSIDAHWNRSGDQITFIGIDDRGFVDLTSFEVFIADYNVGSNTVSAIQQLTSDDTRNHDPCFSPDGTQIAFSASDAGLTNADLVTIETSGGNRSSILDDDGIHGGPLNWGSDGKIYNHSIYIGRTGFTIDAYNTITNSQETLLASPDFGYISPYYSKY